MLLFGWLLMAVRGVADRPLLLGPASGAGSSCNWWSACCKFVVGVMIANRPLAAGVAMTLLMAAFFVVGGDVPVGGRLACRSTAGAWLFLSGVVTLLMGVMIWRSGRRDALWVIGLFVGIDLVFHGWWLVMLALAVRGMPPATTGV